MRWVDIPEAASGTFLTTVRSDFGLLFLTREYRLELAIGWYGFDEVVHDSWLLLKTFSCQHSI